MEKLTATKIITAGKYLVLFGDGFDEEIGANVVDVGHEYRAVLGRVVRRIDVLFDACVPMCPVAFFVHVKVKYGFFGARLDGRQVQLELVRLEHELLQLFTIVQFEECAEAPHQCEHVLPLEKRLRHGAFVLFGRQ